MTGQAAKEPPRTTGHIQYPLDAARMPHSSPDKPLIPPILQPAQRSAEAMFFVRGGKGAVVTCLYTHLYRGVNLFSMVHHLSDVEFGMIITNN
jgi:hypothetical protein